MFSLLISIFNLSLLISIFNLGFNPAIIQKTNLSSLQSRLFWVDNPQNSHNLKVQTIAEANTSKTEKEFWQPLKEPGVGGWISSVAISPHDRNLLVVGGDMLGVTVSSDGGKNWINGRGLKSWEIEEITFDPKLPNKIWLATKSGPYVSLDYGQTWHEKRSGFPNFEWGKYAAPVQQILIDPAKPKRLLAFTGNQRMSNSTNSHQGEVYESVDNGENWKQISSIGTNKDDGNNILDVSFAGASSTRLFAATEEGLFRSDDSGHTWHTPAGNLPLGNQKTVATHPTNPDIVLATVDGHGIYRSMDGGKTFNLSVKGIDEISNEISFDHIRFAPSNPDIVLVGVSRPNDTFMSHDGGKTWSKTTGYQNTAYPMQSRYFRALAIDPHDSAHIVGGTDVSLWQSYDGSSTWQDISSTQVDYGAWEGNGYSGLFVLNIRWDNYHLKHSAVAAMDAGKWISRNDMKSWRWAGSKRGNGISDWGGWGDVSFTNTPAKRQVIYATEGQSEDSQAKGAGVYRSADGGKTWEFKGHPDAEGAQPFRIIAHPKQTNKVWLIWGNKLYFSQDSGNTWTHKLNNAGEIYELIENDKTPEFDLYVGSQKGLWLSKDLKGNNYSLIPGSDTASRAITRMDFVDGDTFYSVNQKNDNYSEKGIWMYGAKKWIQLTNNKNDGSTPFHWVSDIAVDPRNPQRLMAATDQDPFLSVSEATGVWKSEDGGKTWQQFNDGLSMLRVKNIQFKPDSSGTIVIGTTGGGSYIGHLP